MAKHPGGRPFKYKTATALQEGIEKYFADCQGEVLRNSDGDPVLDKPSQWWWEQSPPPSQGWPLL